MCVAGTVLSTVDPKAKGLSASNNHSNWVVCGIRVMLTLKSPLPTTMHGILPYLFAK